MRRRKLTDEENKILSMIQEEYGLQNTEQDVFSDKDGAVIFLKASDGTTPIMIVLTNLALFRKEGIIASDEELRSDWLHPR